MSTKVIEVLDYSAVEPDRLVVRGTVDWVTHRVRRKDAEGKDEVITEPKPVTAKGWLSAMEHYYPPESYCKNLPACQHEEEAQKPARTERRRGKAPQPHEDRRTTDPNHLVDGAIARPMTAEERLAYCKALLEEQHPRPVVPVSLGIAG